MIKPVRKNLMCYKGQTFLQYIYYRRRNLPWPLAGQTAKAEVRPSENSDKLIAELTMAVNGEAGTICMSLSASQTAQLQPGIYAWDLKTTDEQSRVIPWIYGNFIVTGRVTE